MRRSGWWWPFAIAAVFIANAAVMAWVMTIAHADHSFSVEEDYYAKALAWDATARQREASAALGWAAQGVIESVEPGGDRRLVVHLSDASLQPLGGASVIVRAFHRAYPSSVQTLALAEGDPGEYVCPMPEARMGVWCVTVDAVRGEDRFGADILVGAGTTPESGN